MVKILFVCHGNICRSPMAEFIMKDLVEKAGLEGEFQIASAATSMEEYGNPIYPPARRKLQEHGISSEGHRARRMERRDYQDYDYLIGMEHYNICLLYTSRAGCHESHGGSGTEYTRRYFCGGIRWNRFFRVQYSQADHHPAGCGAAG